MDVKVLEKHYRLPILKLDSQNANGRTYGRECLDKLQKLCESERFCGIPAQKSFAHSEVPLEQIGAKVEKIDEIAGTVYADILLLDTPAGFLLQELSQTGDIGARTFGTAQVSDEGIVTEFAPLGVHIGLEKDMAPL